MTTLYMILYVLAVVCFALAVLQSVPRQTPAGASPRGAWLNLVALGLLFWVLVPTIVYIRAH